MRKILLIILNFFLAFSINAQVSEADKSATLQLVSANKAKIGLSTDDIANLKVSNSFVNENSRIRYSYLTQTYQGLPVFQQIQVLSFRDGKLLSNFGSRLAQMEDRVNVKTAFPLITAEAAVRTAIADRKIDITSDQSLRVINSMENGRKIEFNNMGVSRENITAELMWVPDESGKTVKLAWQVYIIPTTTPDYWLVRIDATNNRFIGADNLTVYCNWGTPEHKEEYGAAHKHEEGNFFTNNNKEVNAERPLTPFAITTASYRVVPFPAESPIHPGGTPALRTDPWLAGSANATTLKWNTGLAGTDYNYTRGNNVWAYEDRTAPTNTGTVAKSASSTTALPNLTFNFIPDFTVDPTQTAPVQNQQFNITNLFYWNNIIHDVFYNYGFTEAGGNFQDDNLGRGGVGNDHVNAEAQDASGTNNANFATPADGGSGRMQMYLWTAPTPDRDGDVDNGIIIHEHGHGIAKRVTGGPANVGCLTSAEQGGEGISDYFGLMLTQDWATATLATGFNSPRGIGTYALNEPITGPGIRPKRYTTNFAVNGDTYANLPGQAIPHGVGYVWCTMLWEMTWELINTIGTISPNIYNNTATGGNVVALNLVMEGLRIQPCQPGFVEAKNAILQADINLYGGANQCAIIRAFARRGLGVNALQGSSGSITDQTPDFTGGGPVMSFTQNGVAGIPEGQNIIYNHAITANCQAITGHTLRDTLPLNVTFVSATNGGTYDAGTRVVAWPVNLAINATGNYGLTVNINIGSYFPPIVLLNEVVTSTTIDPFWTAASTTPAPNVWIAHNVRSHSAPNSFFTPNAALVSDQTLATTNSFAIGASAPTLSFWHWYNTESTFDGGVLEISTNGGGSWADIGSANFLQNGYNGTLSTSFLNPIGGRSAWTGNSLAFVETKVNMTPYVNQPTVKLRWRLGSDNSVSSTGWNVDDIQMQTIATVNLRSSLFNAADVRIDIKDTVTVILPIIIANPTVTINQAVGQADPTNISPINFTVVFDQPVINFATGDVTLGGTAAGPLVATVTGGPTTYNVAVTGMTTSGTVIATIAGGVCTNAALDPNQASTSTDNTVTWSSGPLNDLCANAIPIVCGSTTAGTTVGATIDVGTPDCGAATVTSPGVWYSFVGNGGATTLSLCGGASFDTKLGVYSGTCGALVCVGGNDDFCSLQSEVTVPTISGTTYYVLVHSFGGATGAFSLTLTCTCPTLSVDPVANQTVCNGAATTAVTFTGLEPATVYSWTNDNATIGLAVSGTGNIPSFTATNTGAAPVTATITVIPTYVGCPDGPSRTFTITVNPSGQVNAVPNQVLCAGQSTTAVNFTTTVPGTTFNWTNNNTGTGLGANGTGNIASFVTTNATAAPLVSTVTVTPIYGGVGASPVTFSNTANIAIPAGQPVTTTGPSSPYPSPITVSGLPTTGVTVQSITFNGLAHTFASDIEVLLVSPTGQHFVPMSDIGGGTGFDAAATITLKDGSPALPLGSAVITSGTYGPTSSSTTISGFVAPAPAAPYNLAATAGSSTFASIFNTSTNYNGTWSLYIHDDLGGDFGNMAGGWDITFLVPSVSSCVGTPRIFTITVNPTPVAVATPSSQNACSGAAITTIVLSSATAGTTYTWTRDNAAAVTGIPGNGAGNISGSLTNITLAPVTVTFTITPTANGCPGAPITATVTVNPTPQVDQPADQTVCNGAMTAPVNFTSTVAGTVFNWTNNTPSIGLAASGTGNIAAFTATNATTLPVTGTITVTPSINNPTSGVSTSGFLNNNSNALVTFNFRNTNSSPVTITGIESICSTNGLKDVTAFFKTSAINGLPGAISVANGWNTFGTAVITGIANTTTTTTQPFMSGLSLVVPPGATYGIAIQAVNQGTTVAAMRYSSIGAGPFTFTTNGCDLISGANISYGGVAAPGAPTFTPRAFLGKVNFISSCSGPSKTFNITVNPTPTITCPANITTASDVGVCNKTVNYTPTVTGTPAPTLSYVLTGATTGSGAGSGSGLKFNVGVTTVTITATNICATVTCSFTITVTDSQLPVINTQPANRTVCAGSNATFTVAAVTAPSAGGPLSYQWQLWNGSTWNNIAGATAATLTLNSVTQTMNTNSYRVQVIGLCTTITSGFATLYVNPLPTINLTTSIPPALLPTQVLTITATTAPSGGNYVWFKNGVVIAGATGNTLAGLTVSDIGTYRVVYTDGNGCVATSANIDITGQPSDNLYVYPVPNQGVFNVRFYNQANEQVTVRVFDAKGAEVYSRKVLTTIPYTTINVDLSTSRLLANGTYVVDVRGADGRLMGSRKIIVYNR